MKNSPSQPEPNVRSTPIGDVEAGLRIAWRLCLRRRWVIASVFTITVLLAVLVTLRQTKIYSAGTTLVIDLHAPRVLNNEQVQDVVETGTGGFWFSKEYYVTQYRVIMSRAVARRVVDKLRLAKDLRFLGLDQVADEQERARELARLDPVEVLQDRIKLLPVKDSRVVRIEVEDRDPTWSATLANAVAEAYIAENLSVRSTMTQSASEWLETQLADLEAKLSRSTDALFEFKRRHDIVATGWEDRQSMVTQRLVAVNEALTKARVARAQLEARTEQMSAVVDAFAARGPAALEESGGDGFALVNQSLTVQALKTRYFEVLAECADSEVRYFPGHPKLQACAAKASTAREALVREVRTILEGARREYLEAVETERKLTRLLAQAKSDAFELNQHEKDYLELKRANDNNRRLYELVLQRLKETGVTGMMQMSNVRILDRAEPPELPVRPRAGRNLALAAVIGLVAGIVLAALLEGLDTTLTAREQIEELLALPFLGIIPTIDAATGAVAGPAGKDLAVHGSPTSAAAECLRSIRTNLLFMSPEKPLRTILVTSSSPGEGKTTAAASLAQIMADGGSRVLLVDADMRRPRVHKIFGLPSTGGLSSVIVGEVAIDAAIRRTEIPNLDVLPCGPVPPNPNELLHTASFEALLRDVAGRYDRVIIDSPPAGVVSDAVVIGTRVDGTVLVVKAAHTSRHAALRTTRALTDVKARLFGVVMNAVDLTDQRYGYSYEYYRYGYYAPDASK